MVPEDLELRMYRFLSDFEAQHRRVGDADTLLRSAVRALREFFGADGAVLAVHRPGETALDTVFALPRRDDWDLDRLGQFLRSEDVTPESRIMMAPVARRERPWGVLGIRLDGRDVQPGERPALSRIAVRLSERVQLLDTERIREVRARIDGKVMQQLRPKDLFYQILHGIRSLTRYDHSSALVMVDRTSDELELVAEQVAWSKRKSPRIGQRLPLPDGVHSFIAGGAVAGFRRSDNGWSCWEPPDAGVGVAELLDFDGTADSPVPPEGSMLCAPLVSGDMLLGLLKVASRHADSFGSYELELIRRFLPAALIALENLRHTESMELRLLEAERRQALATLARGVSHDVNNAVGAALPLVQQLRDDLGRNTVPADVIRDDLSHIEESLRFCRRVFGGMLSFARSSAQNPEEVDVARTLASVLSILSDSLARQGIEVTSEVVSDLPPVRGGQGDLEQLFLNLATNARDAMPKGGALSIRAHPHDTGVEVVLADTGPGIPPEQMARVFEPFYSTKPGGSGLGLSTCQSIVWRARGTLKISSEPDRGTEVSVRLPGCGTQTLGAHP